MKKKNLFLKSIGTKLTLMFLAVSIIPVAIIGFLSNNSARNALEDSAFNQLKSIGTLKGDLVTSFLERKFRDIEMLAKANNTIDAFDKLKEYHDTGGATPEGPFNSGADRYRKIYDKIDPFFRNYLQEYNFYDIFFICADHGHVMYTVGKENDLGTNLSTGEYRNSGLAKLWAKVVSEKTPGMTDFAYYAPSDENVSFIGAPVFDRKGGLIAVIALQFSTEKINAILQEQTGLGQTGETYLVGDDYLMRSDSRFGTESSILNKKIETESVKLGLQNETGNHIITDYRGDFVLSYFKNLELKKKFGTDFQWVIVAEIDKSEAFAPVNKLRGQILIFGAVIALLVVIIALWFSRMFTKPIIQLKEVSMLLAGGDLTQNIDVSRDDEIGALADSFSALQENLRMQINEITEGVNVLSTSSSEIMATVSQLASGAAETATSVSETTSTVEEVKQTTDVSNQKAIEVAESAQKITLVSQDGKGSVEKTIESMNKIKQQMEAIAGIVIQLSEKSHTIGEIAATVNDLSEQSNLLAVNASIEAAKAGEQGKGFTVVAQEIKNLAERSKESTVQIRSILADIQKEISSAVMATEQGGKVIDSGLALSSTASEVITTLAASVEQASQSNMQIAASSQQQLVGMDQITAAMENIKEASIQTSSSIKQTEESVIDLNKLGEKLLNIMKQYKLK
ncbi:MAG: hypothetical protein B6D64_04960 [Bacteroidetes bacterium 4484_276]|nr:MAG: hypothetical protein B6D64_04960 [Bacteroidetes bacterium 4484_276]